MRDENGLLIDCLNRLNRLPIPYMLTGSMASNFWGIPRTTHDLDFVLMLQQNNLDNFIAAFETGFFLQPASVRKSLVHPYQFNAIDESSALKVDFWILKENSFEQNMFARRREVRILNTSARIATPEDLILHKFYWHKLNPSDRQLRDAAGVFEIQKDNLDLEYIRMWAIKIDAQQELDDLLSGKTKPKST